MRVAIFGGSFDPPHIGHEQIIQQALQNLDIDALFVIPTYLNPFKKKFFAPPKKRLEWIKKLLLPYQKAHLITYEIDQDRAVPTIETIKYLQTTYNLDKIYLIIGADNLQTLPKWKNYEELKKLVHFVVATRDEIPLSSELQKLPINVTISSTQLRRKLDRTYLPASLADEIVTYYTQKEPDEPGD